MTNSKSAEILTRPECNHGEGPVWCPDGTIRWVDMLAGDVLQLHPDFEITRTHVGTVAAALRPRRTGGFVVAIERGFAILDEEGEVHELPELWSDARVRMNEGSCDIYGNFYCGSMGWDAEPGLGSLYRLDPLGNVTRALEGVSISNGLAFTPDGQLAYYVDSATNVISRVKIVDGAPLWAERTSFVTVNPADGVPDGICLDVAGGVWVALWGGGAVHRYSPQGQLTEIITLPTAYPTACALGGPDLLTLFITTSRLIDGDDPVAGALFQARVGIPGEPALLFAG